MTRRRQASQKLCGVVCVPGPVSRLDCLRPYTTHTSTGRLWLARTSCCLPSPNACPLAPRRRCNGRSCLGCPCQGLPCCVSRLSPPRTPPHHTHMPTGRPCRRGSTRCLSLPTPWGDSGHPGPLAFASPTHDRSPLSSATCDASSFVTPMTPGCPRLSHGRARA